MPIITCHSSWVTAQPSDDARPNLPYSMAAGQSPNKGEVRGASDLLKTRSRVSGEVLLEVRNLKTYYPVLGGVLRRRVGWVKAVDDVSFAIKSGETLGLVGESGCGKTTIGRSIIRLLKPLEGQVLFEGNDIAKAKGEDVLLVLQKRFKKVSEVIETAIRSCSDGAQVSRWFDLALNVRTLASFRKQSGL